MKRLWCYQVLLLLAVFATWHVLTGTNILPPFFFGRPLVVLEKVWDWFASGKIYAHANARMLGASSRDLLRSVYLPSATSWVFSSLHTAVGMAFVGAVVGEYLGSAAGVGYLILQAEAVFDINTVFAGILVLTAFALALDSLVTVAEKRLLVWRPAQGETEPL